MFSLESLESPLEIPLGMYCTQCGTWSTTVICPEGELHMGFVCAVAAHLNMRVSPALDALEAMTGGDRREWFRRWRAGEDFPASI